LHFGLRRRILAAQAERILRDTYGLFGSVRMLPGERDCNFHLHTPDAPDYVLKILDREAGSETIDCQLSVLRHLATRIRPCRSHAFSPRAR